MLSSIPQIKDLLVWRGTLYPADLLDVLIIAILIYTLFLFLSRTKTYTVFIGLAFAGALYLIARNMNLYLTYMLLRYFVGVSLVIFVIIFQSEIRKYFEFLGLIGSRNLKVKRMASKSPSIAEIVQASVKMAQDKIGALIVIQGRDNIETILEGGVALDGIISEEVLLSIFDPHSEGHDGALIIKNNRIIQFGAHLPLSINFKEIGKHGTRHSAALGLSESTDSLCIVCSEERGKISVCKDGKLKTLNQYSDLEKELEKFVKDKFGHKTGPGLSEFIKHNFALKIGALTVAAAIWFLTAYQAGIVERNFTIPVTLVDLPKNSLIQNYSPKEIVVTVSGRGDRIFDGINAEDFKLTLDASELENGINKKTLDIKDLVIPGNLTLTDYEPNTVLLTIQKYYSTKVSISPKVKGNLSGNLKLESITITPEQIEILVPEGTEPPAEIISETVDISNQRESVVIPVKLVVPENMRLLNGDATVNIALNITQ